MKTLISQDGTAIAYDREGAGAPLILVDGALCYRSFGPTKALAALLAPHFTVYTYDRRGRGESSDSAPYAIDREVDDLAALIEEAGGSAYVYGISSGAALALEAGVRQELTPRHQLVARQQLTYCQDLAYHHDETTHRCCISKLALFEPPFVVGDSRSLPPENYLEQFQLLLEQGRRGDMVEHFMVNGVGMPPEVVAPMRSSPIWPKLEAVAPTLIYDTCIMEDNNWLPNRCAGSVRVPVLLMNGGASPAWAHEVTRALADAIPGAQTRILADQTHDAAAEAVAPALIEFFNSPA
jgi:pimeloyl-ACP methyl ester carboxylesterase